MENVSISIPIYRAFGLNIQCELPAAGDFGMTLIDSDTADVRIQMAPVPQELENARYKDIYISTSPGKLLLKIKGIARYLISNGTEIHIQTEAPSKEGDVATYAFGSALGALLYQRNILALHGSAIRTPRGAVIFSGLKGAGKSTTASALSARGWEFMSDDVCAIHTDGTRPMLYPGLSRAKLTIRSFSHLLKENPSEPPVSPVLHKYGVIFHNSGLPSPLYALCMLDTTASDPFIEVVHGTDRLSILTDSIYRPQFHQLMENQVQRFKTYEKVLSELTIYRIHRSDDFGKLELLLKEIEGKILS